MYPETKGFPPASVAIAFPVSLPLPPKYVLHWREPPGLNFTINASFVPLKVVCQTPLLAMDEAEKVVAAIIALPLASQAIPDI